MSDSALIALLFLAAAAVILALWLIPALQTRSAARRLEGGSISLSDLLKARNDRRQTLASIIGGLLVLVSLFFTTKTFQMQQRSQVTDHITKAVDELESGKPEVVLGGIYNIGRIANESPEDRWPMTGILTAYVEQHAPIPKSDYTSAWCDLNRNYDPSGIAEHNIQAIADILRSEPEPPSTVTLSMVYASLVKVDFRAGHFGAARFASDDFTGAMLSGATFAPKANLSYSRFFNSNLSQAQLAHVDLVQACLANAQLTGADLRGADLSSADLHNVIDAAGADFTGAVLTNADLRFANLGQARGLTAEQIKSAAKSGCAVLPASLKPLESRLNCLD